MALPVPGGATENAHAGTVDAEAGEDAKDAKKDDGTTPVQVAVLISMPSPLHSRSSYSRSSASMSSSIKGQKHERTMSGDTVDSVVSGKRAARGHVGMGAGMGMGGKEEEEIPVVEIGVVSVDVRERP